ncbi:MAG: carboxypeptidase-like regulatory domain-containing protein [Blastocatellia bacterium]
MKPEELLEGGTLRLRIESKRGINMKDFFSLKRFIPLVVVSILISSLLTVWPLRIRAQSTSGTISGRVIDASGNPMPNVLVTIINTGNGNTRSTLTDRDGNYLAAFLPPAFYSVNVTLAGFNSTKPLPLSVAIELNKMNVVIPPITLTPATTTGGPQATASSNAAENTSIVNLTDAARGGNFNELQVSSLPLGGAVDMRTFDEYALLLPGVAPPPYTPGVRGPGVGFGVGTAGQFSVNGLRARSNNFTVDGSDNNDPDFGVRRQGFIALVPQSVESIQEFQISTLLWNAELGRNFGSQVNAVSKDGGKEFHGKLYGFFTDSSLNARNFFDYTGGPSGGKNAFTRAQAGFVVGGPIIRDRTQFFGSFEHLDVNTSQEQHFATPTSAERRFLGLPRFGVLDPFFGAPPLAVFDTTLGTTPLGRNLLSFYPLPNNPSGPYGVNTFTTILPADGGGSVASFKVTQQVREKSTLYARYNFTDDARILPSVNRAINSTVRSDSRTQDLSLIYNSSLTLRLSNQARFSYGRTRIGFSEYPGSPFIISSSSTEIIGGIQGPRISQTGPIGELIVDPYSPVGVDVFTFPQARVNNTFQYADSMSWTLRSHAFRFGADIRRVQLNGRQDRNYRPLVQFGNALLQIGHLDQSGNPPFPFVLNRGEESRLVSGLQLATVGLPTSIFQTLTIGTPDSTIGLRFTEYNFFFNDNWRVASNFTLDYGMRYEYNTVPVDVNNRIEIALSLANLPSPGNSRADTADRTRAFNSTVDAYRTVLGGRKKIYDPDPNNFGPHLGFAWDPWSDGKTSLRGGYGAYFDTILGAVVSQSRNIFPNEIPINIAPGLLGFDVLTLGNPPFIELIDANGKALKPTIPLVAERCRQTGLCNQIGGSPSDLPALLGQLLIQTGGVNSDLAFTLPAKDLPTPYAQQWHLTAERRVFGDYLVSAAYVGTKGTKLTRLITPNLGPNLTPIIRAATGATTTGVPKPIPFPPFFPPAVVVPENPIALQPARPLSSLGPFQVFQNSANSIYHSLQLEGRKRFTRGYSFTASYTWSHALDDVSDVFPIAGAPILPQDSFNLRLERANANYDLRHRFALSFIWDLPFYRNSAGAGSRWLGGWQLASIIQANTGQPFTLNLPVDANLDGNLTDRPSTTEGLVFTSGHHRQRVALAAGADLNDFFKIGQSGFVARNSARGDAFVNWDVAINKQIRLSERHKLEFRSEFFNLLNRANFGLPIRTLGNPGFGAAQETINPARVIQFALKYGF